MTPLHHAGLCPADFELSLCFYRDGIGLDVLADFTMDADLQALLGRRTSRVRAVFLGSPASPDAAIVELLDVGGPGFADEPPGTGMPSRGVFLLSFQTPVRAALARLAALGLGGVPRLLAGPAGQLTAAVGDPDGVTVELLDRPMAWGGTHADR